jgi:hypothetical protein
MSEDHGMVMTDAHLDYASMSKIGKVTIQYTDDGLVVYCEGFEFDLDGSCRQNGARAIAWARDVLNAALAIDKSAPAGTVTIGVD